MKIYPKPDILVSKCLGFERCRYNGDIINDPWIKKLEPHVNFIAVCPEAEIGLGIPRNPVRLIDESGDLKLYQPSTGKDVTAEMNSFCNEFIKGLGDIDGAILKYRSPSCGPSNVKIYSGYDPGAGTRKGKGFFAEIVSNEFNNLPVEDEGRLNNFFIRENFFTKVFLLAGFRSIYREKIFKNLVEFHSNNKYLYMAMNQSALREMGKLVASHNKNNEAEIFDKYRELLFRATVKNPGTGSWINILQHMYGGMNDKLSENEKSFFLNSIEEYRDERIPLSAVLRIIESWAIRFNEKYILDQSIMNPFPRELIDITDSGKGRDLS